MTFLLGVVVGVALTLAALFIGHTIRKMGGDK